MWIELTSAALQQKLSADEFDAVTSASLPDGVTADDIITEELSRTVSEVRGFVAALVGSLIYSVIGLVIESALESLFPKK